MAILLDLLVFLLLSLVLYILPGWALLTLLGENGPKGFAERLGLSAGLSISLYAVLFYVFYLLKISAGSVIAWIPGMAAAAYISVKILRYLFSRNKGPAESPTNSGIIKQSSLPDFLFAAVFLITVVLLVLTRFLAVQGMMAPSWGDSVHHTVIVQLLQEHGGLFQSWAPYAPISSMTYHFGFHSAAAVWAWMANASPHQSVLLVGQVFGILVVLALYPITARVSKNRWVGLGAVIVAGFLSPIPGFFANWGRFPQLAGIIVGLTVLWFIDVLFTKRGRSSFSRSSFHFCFLLSLLLTGMWLSQYRFSFVVLAAAVVWAVDALWRMRKELKDWLKRSILLAFSGSVAALLLLPWVRITMSNKLLGAVMGARGAELKQIASRSDMGIWGTLDFYYPQLLWILALICLIPALKFTSRTARLVLFWAGLSFLLANPDLVGFSWGSGWVRNENLVFAFFVVLSILIGCVLGLLWKRMSKYPVGAGILVVSAALLLTIGGWRQLRIVDPFFQLVEPSDVAAFRWIRQNVPEESRFLVNGFVIGQGNMAYGSDAGWWLPYFTHRDNTVPPAQYSMERLEPGTDKVSFARIIREVRDSEGKPGRLRDVLCRENITHVFLGERKGSVGYNIQEMIPEAWLQENPSFTLLFREGNAQVWRFEREGCEQK